MWELDFISEQDFKRHVRNTIKNYGEKLAPYDLKRFNSNIVDPIKLIFDKTVYRYNREFRDKKIHKTFREAYPILSKVFYHTIIELITRPGYMIRPEFGIRNST